MCSASKPYTVYVYAHGCYKITTFVAHLTKNHQMTQIALNQSHGLTQQPAATIIRISFQCFGSTKKQADTKDGQSSNSDANKRRCTGSGVLNEEIVQENVLLNQFFSGRKC